MVCKELFGAYFRRFPWVRAGNQPILECSYPNRNEQYPNDVRSRFFIWRFSAENRLVLATQAHFADEAIS